MIEHVRAWAADEGFELRQDAARNLVVRVPATAGRDSAPVIVLQGHLDMVCERLPDSPNDPAEGRIVLIRDGDWLTADGTTLGADNGIGIAAMMALAEDTSLPHGPLELLMTVNEEIGGPGEGASGLDPALVSGATLLNLDSEEDGTLTVGSASSTDTSIRVEKPREACEPGARDAVGVGERRARRAFRHGHRSRPGKRDQGARARAPRGARRRAVPARLAAGRQELERDPPRCYGDLLAAARARGQPSALPSRPPPRRSATPTPRPIRASP